MVGSAGTCQPAAATRRSQARRRARPAYDAGVFPAPSELTNAQNHDELGKHLVHTNLNRRPI